MNLADIGYIAAGAVLSSLLLAVFHWFPWLNGLSRLAAYVCGTASLLIGFSLWAVLCDCVKAGIAAWCIAAVGGATVAATYAIDKVITALGKARKAEAIDEELAE